MRFNSLALGLISFLLLACSQAQVSSEGGSKGGTGGGILGGVGGNGGGGINLDTNNTALPPESSLGPTPPGCGNGELTKDEACDDGNTTPGDGCAGNCLRVEPGFSCVPAGQACHRVARCGDGVSVLPELCDDGNKNAGDGCSPTCKVEVGWKCEGSPSKCSHTTCGDKKTEGAESCEDGNDMPFDGCSAECQNEPNCKGDSCTSRCGDGIVLGEDCDDGNNLDGDGCNKDCKIEPGYTCTQPDIGQKMMVPAVYRDFKFHNPSDFQAGVTGSSKASPGMVKDTLDSEGKPVFTGITGGAIHVESTSSFEKWYRNVSGVNHATTGKLALWNNGSGAYVNRHGANGEQWTTTARAYYCGNVGQEKLDDEGNPIPCTSKYQDTSSTNCTEMLGKGMEMLKCETKDGSYQALFIVSKIDGEPTFFPVDGDNFSPSSEESGAKIPPIYEIGQETGGTWPWHMDDKGNKLMHNFSFTSEVHYWFLYQKGKSYTLDFTGDDDVWVFVNKKLAVDLGGIHTPINGSVTLDASSASKFGLQDGKVYEIAVFQAERQWEGSSYRLTLSGFNAGASECKPVCGDGIVGIGEECDDGANNGGYGQCGEGCTLGAFCGDGIKQSDEDCDDGGLNGTVGHCPSGCRNLIID